MMMLIIAPLVDRISFLVWARPVVVSVMPLVICRMGVVLMIALILRQGVTLVNMSMPLSLVLSVGTHVVGGVVFVVQMTAQVRVYSHALPVNMLTTTLRSGSNS